MGGFALVLLVAGLGWFLIVLESAWCRWPSLAGNVLLPGFLWGLYVEVPSGAQLARNATACRISISQASNAVNAKLAISAHMHTHMHTLSCVFIGVYVDV